MNEKSVAEFMINEILEKGYVYQEYLVHDIQENLVKNMFMKMKMETWLFQEKC